MVKIIKPSNTQATIIRQNIRHEMDVKRRKARNRADAQWKRICTADAWSALANLGG